MTLRCLCFLTAPPFRQALELASPLLPQGRGDLKAVVLQGKSYPAVF